MAGYALCGHKVPLTARPRLCRPVGLGVGACLRPVDRRRPPPFGGGEAMTSPWRKFRVTPGEDAELEAGADRFETTVSGFIRMAVQAALTQQPILLPEERAAFGKALEQFRQAGVNLNSLLRQTYLFQ